MTEKRKEKQMKTANDKQMKTSNDKHGPLARAALKTGKQGREVVIMADATNNELDKYRALATQYDLLSVAIDNLNAASNELTHERGLIADEVNKLVAAGNLWPSSTIPF
jgi:hypothetical protein